MYQLIDDFLFYFTSKVGQFILVKNIFKENVGM